MGWCIEGMAKDRDSKSEALENIRAAFPGPGIDFSPWHVLDAVKRALGPRKGPSPNRATELALAGDLVAAEGEIERLKAQLAAAIATNERLLQAKEWLEAKVRDAALAAEAHPALFTARNLPSIILGVVGREPKSVRE